MPADRRHATAISLRGMGVLFLGDSGAGKSSLATRLIAHHGAVLVGDDVVQIEKKGTSLYISSPQSIAGIIELFGIGLIQLPYVHSVKLDVVVHCNLAKIERYNENIKWLYDGVSVHQISLNAHSTSADAAIVLYLEALQSNATLKDDWSVSDSTRSIKSCL